MGCAQLLYIVQYFNLRQLSMHAAVIFMTLKVLSLSLYCRQDFDLSLMYENTDSDLKADKVGATNKLGEHQFNGTTLP